MGNVLVLRSFEARVSGEGPVCFGCGVVDWTSEDHLSIDARE
jgi:hypothetical protein